MSEHPTTDLRIKPPHEHWYRRWHWLRDEDGELYLADWSYSHGWHGGWNGRLDANSDDFDGWAYVGPIDCPEKSSNV